VVIGRDTRPSGPALLGPLAGTLVARDVQVLDVGVLTTPGIAFLTRQRRADLGIIISASHNPPQYNGIKLVGGDGLRLQRGEEAELEALIDDCPRRPAAGARTPGQPPDGRHLTELYLEDLAASCPARSLERLRVVLDCANGAASAVAPQVFRNLRAEVFEMHVDPRGDNINRHCGSEHVRRNPEDLTTALWQHGATLGFAFDGDGDRLVVVDSDGWVYDGEDLLFILATYYHERNLLRHNVVVTSELANRGLADALDRAGIRTEYAPKGDRNLEATLRQGDYLLGGEPGGNVIFNDGHHTAADAIHTALVLSSMLVTGSNLGLGQVANRLRKRPQALTSLRLPAALSAQQKARLHEEFKPWEAKLGEDSRILAWDSTTEPGLLRVLVEGGRTSTRAQVSSTLAAVRRLVSRAAEQPPEPTPELQVSA